MTDEEKRLGRPPVDPELLRDAPVIYLRLTRAERAIVDEAAEGKFQTTIEWVRETIVRTAKRQL